jgi:hypothetical protein
MLRSDCENRVLIFPGCFNPPHLGHIALLWHAYLYADSKTIAAMFVLLPDGSIASKRHTEVDGKSFKLSVHQRTQLLQDDVLGRFTWVFPDEADDAWNFVWRVRLLAGIDGYSLSYSSLHGGDAFDGFGGEIGWGTGSTVASNVS